MAGADMLKNALMSSRADQPKTIGLFDKDEEGIRKFEKLGKSFLEDSSMSNVKVHNNNTVAAFLIPDILSKKDYINARNLSIEFVFPDEYLLNKYKGLGLEFSQKSKNIKVGNISVCSEETTEPYYREIINNKVYFAKNIVPTFPIDAFENFKKIFESFTSILAKLN